MDNKMSKKDWSNATINGYDFEWVYNDEDDCRYECRGDVMYDDEHDEMPEPGLWRAAEKLANGIRSDGYAAEPSHSEKGWVEVQVFNK
jgi:hypothetical protein